MDAGRAEAAATQCVREFRSAPPVVVEALLAELARRGVVVTAARALVEGEAEQDADHIEELRAALDGVKP